MAARPQLPGMRWLHWLRNAALRSGVLTGVYLSCVFVAWLFVANRVPELESIAGIRNLVAGAAVIAVIGYVVHRLLGSQDRQQGAAALTAQGAKVTNSHSKSGRR